MFSEIRKTPEDGEQRKTTRIFCNVYVKLPEFQEVKIISGLGGEIKCS